MPTKIKEVQQPRGLSRLMFRLPITLYHARLGWLLGDRFLELTHTGRKSGLPRHTVIEVLQHDKASDTYYVLAGWGEKSDWLRNIKKTPRVAIHVGHRRFSALARRLSPEEAELTVLDYAHRHPMAIRVLPRLLGYSVDGTEEDFRALARLGVVVAFQPVPPTSNEQA